MDGDQNFQNIFSFIVDMNSFKILTAENSAQMALVIISCHDESCSAARFIT